jgi:hypothetical protein
MANMVGGDKLVLNKEYVTAAANLADKSLVTAGGAVATAYANGVYGVVEKDTKSGDLATVKTSPGILEVLAGGTVTAGAYVEAVAIATVYGNIDGTSTAIAAAGVQDATSTNKIIGKAHTGGVANETVLVELVAVQPAFNA